MDSERKEKMMGGIERVRETERDREVGRGWKGRRVSME